MRVQLQSTGQPPVQKSTTLIVLAPEVLWQHGEVPDME